LGRGADRAPFSFQLTFLPPCGAKPAPLLVGARNAHFDGMAVVFEDSAETRAE
jgi:hypothetical protein